MGMPNVTISFKTSAANAIKRSDKGVIGMILRSANEKLFNAAYKIKAAADIPAELDAINANYIKQALIGYINMPKQVQVYIITEDEGSLGNGLTYFETVEVDYLVGPHDCTEEEAAEIALWVKQRRQNAFTVKAVLPNSAADSEGIINFATNGITSNSEVYTAAAYCARIAGIIAGTPMNISATYAPLSEVSDVIRLDKDEMDKAIEEGKFILWHDGEKVKTARAVNSFVTTTSDKGEAYKKIKVVEAVDMIQRDIRRTCEDSYIGKYSNSYDNKCLLITAIKAYLEELERADILKNSSSQVGIDIEAQSGYLKSQGIDTSEMSEQEIKEAATGSKVFIKGQITVLDAIEDVAVEFGLTV